MFRFTNLIIFRMTKDCNLNCSYCFMKDKEEDKGKLISFELYRKITDRIAEQRVVSGKENEELSFILHGGEVLLLGEKELYKRLDYAKNVFDKNNLNYNFGCQSNITLLTDDIAKVLQKFDVKIGVSFDGIDGANNARCSFSQEFFEEKFTLLEDSKVDFGFIGIATKDNVDKIETTKRYMDKISGSYKINFVEEMIDAESKIELTGKEFFELVAKPEIDNLIEGIKPKDSSIQALLMSTLIDILTEHETTSKSGCDSRWCGTGISMIGIEPNGTINYCDRHSESFPEIYMMNALDYDFLGLYQLKKVIEKGKITDKTYKETGCDTCYASYICSHGCDAFYYSKHKKHGIDQVLICGYYKSFYSYILKNLDSILQSCVDNNFKVLSNDKIKSLKKFNIKNKISATMNSLEISSDM